MMMIVMLWMSITSWTLTLIYSDDNDSNDDDDDQDKKGKIDSVHL